MQTHRYKTCGTIHFTSEHPGTTKVVDFPPELPHYSKITPEWIYSTCTLVFLESYAHYTAEDQYYSISFGFTVSDLLK